MTLSGKALIKLTIDDTEVSEEIKVSTNCDGV